MGVEHLPGIKTSGLSACICCGKPMAHDGNLTFLRMRIEEFALDPDACHQAACAERMAGPVVARMIGTNPDVAKRFSDHEGLLCQPCAVRAMPPIALRDALADRAMSATGAWWFDDLARRA